MSVYGYIRVSSGEQVKSGISLDEQRQQILRWSRDNKLGVVAKVFKDAGVSGATELRNRDAGRILLKGLSKGDVVIITKLDRMFRKASDALNTVEDFKRRGISLHVKDLSGDVSGNGISKLFLTVMSAVAEWERSIISERQKDAKRQMREQGRYLGGRKKTGVKRLVKDGKVFAVEDEAEVRAINYIRAHGKQRLKELQANIEAKYGAKKSLATISRIKNYIERYQSKSKFASWKGKKR